MMEDSLRECDRTQKRSSRRANTGALARRIGIGNGSGSSTRTRSAPLQRSPPTSASPITRSYSGLTSTRSHAAPFARPVGSSTGASPERRTGCAGAPVREIPTGVVGARPSGRRSIRRQSGRKSYPRYGLGTTTSASGAERPLTVSTFTTSKRSPTRSVGPIWATSSYSASHAITSFTAGRISRGSS